MRVLIALIVLVFGALHVLTDQLATFQAPKVDLVPPVAVPISQPVSAAITVPVAIAPPVAAGAVTDAQRFQLARAAGWNADDAIIATAISIAEDGSGSPTIMSPENQNHTYDLGLWQINSSHWSECGGQAALTVPINNAVCGYMIYVRQHWCAWSTYGTVAMCGLGHDNSYAKYIGRAQAAAGGN